ncbi:ANKRD50 [Symbiodinium sp. CCMP2592]|nr:ANKRD50 [Symbiodinium sp. CCMP2592]
MVNFISILLMAFAATVGVVRGVRLEDHPVWWVEHPVSSPEKLQRLVTTRLLAPGPTWPGLAPPRPVPVVATAEGPKEEPSDSEAHERALRDLVFRIKQLWQSNSADACHQQLGHLMNNLTLACEALQPTADWLLDYYPAQPKKTCAESVSDIFVLGNELVETLQVSRHAVASFEVPNLKTRLRYQALSFLRRWLVTLARTHHHALLWAGFWDGDPQQRTTKATLSNFAKATDHATVHPDSFLGQAIEASQNLGACYKDAQTSALAGNMWSIASMSFVLGMREKAQGTVIALVNKQITGERNLSQSVLSTHEIPTVGLAAWGLGFWSPKVILVDLMGTCDKTSPALQKQLLARLPSWASAMRTWSPAAFATRSRLQWQCIDCSGACSLDRALAEHVRKLVKAKEEQDRKDQELQKVVSPRVAGFAAAGLGTEEATVGNKLAQTLRGFGRWQQAEEVKGRTEHLLQKLSSSLQGHAELGADLHLGGPAMLLRVRQLLQQNADPNAPGRLGKTALICTALENGHLEVVEALLKAGAQTEARDENGGTALITAASKLSSNLKVVEALVKAGAQLDARSDNGFTALMSAAEIGHVKVVEALVKAGAQLETRSERGFTALGGAAEEGNVQVVQVLVKARAQLEARTKDGSTALIRAAGAGQLAVLQVLVQAGAQLEPRNEKGVTALLSAAYQGQSASVEALVRARAQLEARVQEGSTALTIAAFQGHLAVVEVLVKAGVELEARSKDSTALMCAAGNGYLEVVQVLVKARAEMEARDENGSTALSTAAGRGHTKVVEALLKAGAPPKVRDEFGKTAFDHAEATGHPDIADILNEASRGLVRP